MIKEIVKLLMKYSFCPSCKKVLVNTAYCEDCKVHSDDEKEIISKLETELLKPEVVSVCKPRKNNYIEHICPQCGKDKAEYSVIQLRAGDEAPTEFFKCIACNFVDRRSD